MMNLFHMRHCIVRPALKAINRWSPAAENLVMCTGMQESRYTHLTQLRGGPARGFWQVEGATHTDYWVNYLAHNSQLAQDIMHACGIDPITPFAALTKMGDRPVWDLRYGAIMCRVHYLRIPEALPAYDDIEAMAKYWKKYYNTVHGKGSEREFIAACALVPLDRALEPSNESYPIAERTGVFP